MAHSRGLCHTGGVAESECCPESNIMPDETKTPADSEPRNTGPP